MKFPFLRAKAAAAPPPLSDEVSLHEVSLRRGEREVLHSLSLSLNEKRIGLIGRNGSGKSSLVRLLNGLCLADSGRVDVFGLDPQQHRALLPARVGFIFQNPDHQIIFPTVAEELAFGLTQQGEDNDRARERALALLEEQGCGALAGRPVHDLSGGQKQLVCILAILIMQPDLLILDEPFASLDLPTRNRLLRWLLRRDERLIMVTHELECLQDFDRVIWLDEGRVVADGAAAGVIAQYRRAMAEADDGTAGLLP
ncbi:ABC transporter ATP-binding protein [Granulosicoccaceae sp. 1_MG-2023]|nr:ABC transporter ATP-binding protein [Granulosicoccaceae sp. 1_MG-2023]